MVAQFWVFAHTKVLSTFCPRYRVEVTYIFQAETIQTWFANHIFVKSESGNQIKSFEAVIDVISCFVSRCRSILFRLFGKVCKTVFFANIKHLFNYEGWKANLSCGYEKMCEISNVQAYWRLWLKTLKPAVPAVPNPLGMSEHSVSVEWVITKTLPITRFCWFINSKHACIQ